MQSKAGVYYPAVDGLRAIAILAVIINHYNPVVLPSGFLGVDVFFVISGFVITSSLLERDSANWKDFLLGFYCRRIKRLAPALILCVLVTGLLGSIFTVFPPSSIRTGIYSLFGASNIYLFKESSNYFADTSTLNLFTQTWSLGVEEQFYLVFPILLGLCLLGRKQSAVARRVIWLSMLGLNLSSLALYSYLSRKKPDAAFYLMPCRFWELGLGCMVALSPARLASSRVQRTIALISLVSIVIILFFPENQRFWTSAFVVLFTGVSIHLIRSRGYAADLLASRPFVGVGLVSYSLYLWHWPVLAFSKHLIGTSGNALFLLVVATLALSLGSYFLIEKPLRRLKWSASSGWTILYGALASSCAAAFLLTLAGPLQAKMKIVKIRNDQPSFLFQEKCQLPASSHPIEDCLVPSTQPFDHRIYLMGDSHAGNLLKAIETVTQEKKLELRYLSDRALPNHLVGLSICGETVCEVGHEVEARIRFIKTYFKRGDVLVFSLSRDRIYKEYRSLYYSGDLIAKESKAALAKLNETFPPLIEAVLEKGARVLLVDDIPKVCLAEEYGIWNNGIVDGCKLSRNQSLLHRAPLSQFYHEMASRYSHVAWIDPHAIFCPGETCSNFLNDRIIYTDSSPHLTAEASRLMTEFIRPYL